MKSSVADHIIPVVSPESFSLLLQENGELKTEVLYLKHELEKLRRMIFGAKSERFVAENPSQLSLGLDIATQAPGEPVKETITYERKKTSEKEKIVHSRQPLPAHLPRQEVVIEPETKIEGAKKIGEEVTEILEYTPGRLYVKRYIRPKYALPQKQGVIIADMPSLPIPKGNAGASLIAHVIISKFIDHLPFYRQIQQFKRQNDITIAESTLTDWFSGACKSLELLYQKQVDSIVKSSYLMCDETPIPVLDRDKPGATHRGYHWVYYSPLEKQVCFHYQKGRGREGPMDFLKNFQGALQTDGYSVYDIFEKQKGITLLACMAHARRYFDQALTNDNQKAGYVLEEIKKLYEQERIAREEGLSYEARKELRVEKCLPVLKGLEAWMKKNIAEVYPKSAISVAIGYSLGHWARLKRYIEDGRYEIDNNLIENSIRPVALGRKNYLFAGSHEAAQRAAMIYSFFGTCKINDVNPQDWLIDVLTQLPDYKANRLEELLPQNWKFSQK